MSLSEVSVSAGTYRGDRNWSDQYIPAVKAIVGPLLLTPSDIKQDTTEATDLIVLRARDMRIAARMRRPGFSEQYPFEFTIRQSRANGSKTEMAKIVDGWGDWFFYGHAGEQGYEICRWWLVDLNAWRGQMIRTHRKAGNPTTRSNRDGTTRFTVFDVREFLDDPPILIAGSHPVIRTERDTMGGYGIRSS